MMQLYAAALEEIQLSHDELRRHYQLLDVYVETLRIRKRLEALERNVTAKLVAS
jgi:hypothetical protein